LNWGGVTGGFSHLTRSAKWATFRNIDRLKMSRRLERRRPARPMHPTLSPALVRPRAARGPVAIMFSLNSLKAGAEIEWSNLVPFVGLELKTARTATVPSSSICPTTSVAVGYHLQRHRRRCSHLHLGSRVCRICAFGTSGMSVSHRNAFRLLKLLKISHLHTTDCPMPWSCPHPCLVWPQEKKKTQRVTFLEG
jgi:hypothetical protein